MMALLVKYHRKKVVSKRDDDFAQLAPEVKSIETCFKPTFPAKWSDVTDISPSQDQCVILVRLISIAFRIYRFS
jgi:hypothetical protein